MSYSLLKFDKKRDGDIGELCQNFVQKWSKCNQKLWSLNFDDGYEFADLENHPNRCFVQISELHEMHEESALSRAFLAIFIDFKMFAKMHCPLVKLKEKRDGDVDKPVYPNILELCHNFLQNRGSD